MATDLQSSGSQKGWTDFIFRYRHTLSLHGIVIIFSFPAILGKLISIAPAQVAWYRMGIGFLALVAYFALRSRMKFIGWKAVGKFLLVGVIIAGHWITFFQAIEVSNISVTLACISSASFFVALIEPLFFGRKIIPYELLFGLMVVGGLYLIFQFEGEYTEGIIYSLISALLAAFFTVINGKLIKEYPADTITMFEMLGGTLSATLGLAWLGQLNNGIFDFQGLDLIYLLILGIICTAFAFVGSIWVMKELSPFTVSVSINLEPVYGILMAIGIFGTSEYMSLEFYIGASVILLTIIGNGILKNKSRQELVN